MTTTFTVAKLHDFLVNSAFCPPIVATKIIAKIEPTRKFKVRFRKVPATIDFIVAGWAFASGATTCVAHVTFADGTQGLQIIFNPSTYECEKPSDPISLI